MASHNLLGTEGEKAAAIYLTQKGYSIIDRNWRIAHLEIDLIANWFGEVVFVEVKTRSLNQPEEAYEAVTPEKKRNLIAAARAYLAEKGLNELPYRFDIITLTGTKRPFHIRHYRNAYTERSEMRRYHKF